MKPYRNQRLRDYAQYAPECFYCGKHNDGSVVMAHWRSISMGAGMGVKPHDLPCYVCSTCHDLIDQRVWEGMTSDDREQMWLRAHRNTVLWLLQSGLLGPTDRNPALI